LRDHLFDEFSDFYLRYRCEWAPAAPRRLFNLARKLAEDRGGRVSLPECLSAAYEVLLSLFGAFDPAKYAGNLSPEDHFANLFARYMKQRLIRLERMTDRGRPGDIVKFQDRPELGLWKEGRDSPRDEAAREWVRDAVAELPDPERAVVHARYWDDLSDSAIGRALKIHRKTVRKRHDDALDRLRDKMAS
jgi:RNA polymerase sigma factor (sigma-70 family)